MEFFDVRSSQWPGAAPQEDGVPWMSFQRPQEVIGDATSVSVAQHPQLRFGDSVLYGEETNCGRAYHDGSNDK